MTRLAWSERALSELDDLVISHSLPADTRRRIEESAQPLVRFPRIGPEIKRSPDDAELRFLVGPWPWLVLVYVYVVVDDLVVVVSAEDGRAAISSVGRERR